MAPASIADLPNELLIDILGKPTFSTEALYFLGLLSRRLNFIALPIYFARTGVDLETRSATIALTTSRFDPLSALQVYLFLPPTMEKIVCSFPHPSCLTIFPFLAQFERVYRFLARLTAVGAVTLELDNRIEGRCLTVGKDNVLDAWASQYGCLLSCVIDKGCSSLAVINGLHLTETYELHRPQKILPRQLTRLFTRPDPGSGLTFQRDPEWGVADIVLVLPSFSGSGSQLTSLNIHSATLLVPPGLVWTLTVLRKSLIRSLVIRMSVMADMGHGAAPLAAVALNLTSISLIDIHPCNEPAIFAFLAHFPVLTDLELTHVDYFTCTQLKLKGPRALQPFPHLLHPATAGFEFKLHRVQRCPWV
ncbi:hypothetical protein DFH08DRAFT_1083823 [Mycena albidolilacea]|uniref:F-box domain-containing protein n=1 Tax=Mycena albidolilacea TaxID=1033008 RepID=A0AAD7EJZ2_9AGAR|nr:hypothetical protein DFH08DRAFT_1083823 [Mycena albidolilacea]